jgi:hypothetical protein
MFGAARFSSTASFGDARRRRKRFLLPLGVVQIAQPLPQSLVLTGKECLFQRDPKEAHHRGRQQGQKKRPSCNRPGYSDEDEKP